MDDLKNVEVDDFLAHYGVKGMKWGVRKKYTNYRNEVHQLSPGAVKTSVKTKNGDTITVVKAKPLALSLAVGKLRGLDKDDHISAMEIHDSNNKKVGSFQVWREPNKTVRGEWLTVNEHHQGNGYSKAAIEGLIKAAKKDPNIDRVVMQVPNDAAAAQHIYGNLGFKKYKDLDFGLSDWQLDVRNKGRK